MARILSICSRTPYPLTGGAKLRLFNTARLLAEEHTVDLLIVDEAPIEPSRLQALEEVFNSVQLFAYPKYRFYLNTLPGIASRRPVQTFYYSFGAVKRWMDRNVNKYDLLYCNHIRTTEYARPYNMPKVVDFVDAISRNYEKSGKDAEGLWRAIYPVEAERVLHYERTIAREFDHSFVITDVDQSYIEGNDDYSSLTVLPNGVSDEIIKRGPAEPPNPDEPPQLVFLGKMDYFPNVTAATFFVESVFPRVRDEFPDVTFAIVGTSPTDDVRKLTENPGVEVTGFVDDPLNFLETADVVVAPMQHGAGLQNKVIEAMGLGKPVVTTPLGQEGIDASDGDHLCVGETPTELTTAVIDLLNNNAERQRIGDHARDRIEARYTWADIHSLLLDDVNRLLE